MSGYGFTNLLQNDIQTRQYIAPLLRSPATSALSPLNDSHRERVKLYELYWRYYRGHHKQIIKVEAGKPNDNVILNWSRKIVDTGISFLFGHLPEWTIGDEATTEPAEEYLNQFWASDPGRRWNGYLFLQSLAQNGAICGTAVARLYPPRPGEKWPRLRNIDPALLDIRTDPNDVDEIIGYDLVWYAPAAETWLRHKFDRNDGGLSWTIFEQAYNGRVWLDTVDPMVWEYDFAPVFHAPNLILANSQYGISDLEDADVNDAINFVASQINRILRFHAHPRTIGKGFEKRDIQTNNIDQMWVIPKPESDVYNLEMNSDLSASRAHKADLEEAYHQVAGVPRLDPAQVNLGALSGYALQILYTPLLAKTTVKRGTYGGMLEQINRALLIMAGYDADDLDMSITWPNPLPENPAEKDARLQVLVNAGASLKGAAAVLGYNDKDIERLTAGGNAERPVEQPRAERGIDTDGLPDAPTRRIDQRTQND